jgi:hypothetical protein
MAAAAAAGAAASSPWRRLAAALGLVPVAITLSELVGSCMFVDGRSMQPTLNPQHDGCVGFCECMCVVCGWQDAPEFLLAWTTRSIHPSNPMDA